MSITLEEFQDAARRRTIEPGKRPEPYSPEQRAFALEYTHREVSSGRSKAAVLSELGISYQTLRNWQAPKSGSSKALRPVTLNASESKSGGVTLVTPGDYRVEGLCVDDVVALLEKLR